MTGIGPNGWKYLKFGLQGMGVGAGAAGVILGIRRMRQEDAQFSKVRSELRKIQKQQLIKPGKVRTK